MGWIVVYNNRSSVRGLSYLQDATGDENVWTPGLCIRNARNEHSVIYAISNFEATGDKFTIESTDAVCLDGNSFSGVWEYQSGVAVGQIDIINAVTGLSTDGFQPILGFVFNDIIASSKYLCRNFTSGWLMPSIENFVCNAGRELVVSKVNFINGNRLDLNPRPLLGASFIERFTHNPSLPSGYARVSNYDNNTGKCYPKNWWIIGPSALLSLVGIGIGWRKLWQCTGLWPDDRPIIVVGLPVLGASAVLLAVSLTQALVLLTAADCSSENISIFSVVIPKLKLSDVQMQIFSANFVISPDDPTLQDRPKTFNCVRMDRTNDVLPNGVIDGLMREAVLQPHVAWISIGAEKANAVRYCLAYESLKRLSVCVLDHASNDVAFALNCTNDSSLSGIPAPASAAFLVPMAVLITAANVGFVNLYDSAELLDVLNHGGSDFVTHEPSRLVRAEAHIAEDLEGAHALFADQHQVRDSVPVFQGLIRVLKDCAGQVREAITCGATRSTHSALPMVAGGKGIDLEVTAAGASYALRPAARHEVNNAIVLSLKQRVELGRCHLVDCFRAGHANSPSTSETFA
jgi:hypothetical protein